MSKNEKWDKIFLKKKCESTCRWALAIFLSPWRFFKLLCFSIGLFLILFFVGVGFYIHDFYSSLPDFDQMSFKQIKSLTQTKVGRLMNGKKHFWVNLENMNRDLIYAIVFSEDATYFEHNGVNYQALIDSLAQNIKSRSYTWGASTIGQQVVKNIFLSNTKSLIRKLKEIIITHRLENRLTKNEILELYLNLVEFGPDIYGVHGASWKFFKIAPKKINAQQGALMAVMLPSPRKNYYSIFQNKYLSKKQKRKIRMIIKTMHYKEFIGPDLYQKYIDLRTLEKNIKA